MKLIWTVSVFLLSSLVLPTLAPAANRDSTEPVYDESDGQLESIFADASPSPEAKKNFLENGAFVKSSGACQQVSGGSGRGFLRPVANHILNWLRPSKVYAQSCSGGSCGGSYMRSSSRPCGSGCSWTYSFYYSDPQNTPYYRGWQYVGAPACCSGSKCAEAGCNNW